MGKVALKYSMSSSFNNIEMNFKIKTFSSSNCNSILKKQKIALKLHMGRYAIFLYIKVPFCQFFYYIHLLF